MVENNADVLVGSLQKLWQAAEYLDLGIPHTQTNLIWYVPAPAVVPRDHAFHRAFHLATWIASITSFIAISIVLGLEHFFFSTNISKSLIETAGIFFTQPLKRHYLSRTLKLFIIVSYLFILNVATAYQASLMVFLTHAPREIGFKTVSDIINSSVFIYIQDSLTNSEKNDPILDDPLLKYRTLRIPFALPTMAARTDRKLVVIGPKIVSQIYIQFVEEANIFDKFGQPLLLILPEKGISIAYAMYFKRGYPMIKEVNTVTQWLIEAGLPNIWADSFIIRKRKKLELTQVLVKLAFSLKNMKWVFWILIAMLTASLVIFVLEFVVYFGEKYGKQAINKIRSYL